MGDAKNRCRIAAVLATVFFLASARSGAAQTTTAGIGGTVKDSSGAVLPGATISVKALETGGERTTVTDTTGRYQIASLSVGRYEVRAELAGFQAQIVGGINLTVGETAAVNFTLSVGALTSEVTVTAEARLVDTSTVSSAGLVGEREVKDLPLNGRSFDNLITLNAGTTNYTSTRAGGGVTGASNLFAVSGRRPAENQFLLNGVPWIGLSATSNEPGGVSGQLLGIDAIREFVVQKDTYSAELGGRAGGQINVVTMSGSNQFRGSIFEFARNSALDARNFFDKGDIPPFKRNNFGGSVGGALIPSKTFFFGNYEGFRQQLGLSSVAIVPDANARLGFLPDPKNPGQLLNVGVAPGIAPYFDLWPLPNGANLGDGTALSFSNPKQTINENFFTGRIDHNLTSTQTLSVNYTRDKGDNFTPSDNPYTASTFDLTMAVASAELKQVLSNTIVNTVRFGYTHATFHFDPKPTVDYQRSLAFIAGSEIGVLGVGGSSAASQSPGAITFAGAATSGQNETMLKTQLTYQDNLEINKGAHLIGLGFSAMNIREDMDSATPKNGTASFAGLTEFLQGKLRQFDAVLRSPVYDWRSWQLAWYLQDTVHLSSRLTADFGLRHEIWTGWNEANGHASNYVIALPSDVLPNTPTVGTSPLVENNGHWLFGPRTGLVWDVDGKGTTAVRAGFGVYYSLQDELGFGLQKNPPFTTRIQLLNTTFPLNLTRDSNVPAAVVAPSTTDPYLHTPRVNRYGVNLQRQVGSAMAVSIGYVGSHGYNEEIAAQTNSAAPIICSSAAANCPAGLPDGTRYFLTASGAGLPRKNPTLGAATQPFFFLGHSDYNALQLEFTGRAGRGVRFRGNYTLSKSNDISSTLSANDGTGDSATAQDATNIDGNYGPSAFDVRHRVSFNATYEVPAWSGGGIARVILANWQVNGVVNAQTGIPFTPLVGFDIAKDSSGGGSERPNVAPGADLSQVIGTPQQWYDPKMFVLPTPGTYGNAGRNSLRGPGQVTVDASLFRLVPLSAGMKLQFRLEVFNLLNHTNFGLPGGTIFNSNGTYSGSAGLIKSTATTSRQVQLGIKMIW